MFLQLTSEHEGHELRHRCNGQLQWQCRTRFCQTPHSILNKAQDAVGIGLIELLGGRNRSPIHGQIPSDCTVR